jgi:hypothetical protein
MPGNFINSVKRSFLLKHVQRIAKNTEAYIITPVAEMTHREMQASLSKGKASASSSAVTECHRLGWLK